VQPSERTARQVHPQTSPSSQQRSCNKTDIGLITILFTGSARLIAITTVSVAGGAIAAFEAATANEQKACLTFILFKDRRP
jgi:hypothetical protein